jgi:hypothetical protein
MQLFKDYRTIFLLPQGFERAHGRLDKARRNRPQVQPATESGTTGQVESADSHVL